jgi:hypothetical protein
LPKSSRAVNAGNEVEKMRKIASALAALLFFLPGSVLADTAFTCPDTGVIKLNETTRAEIKAAYPYGSQKSTVTKNGEMVDVVTFTQVSTRKRLAIEKKVTPARALTFYVQKDVVVGYEFVSSFKEDHTDFDDTKAREIKQGETTVDGVEKLLGKACGQHVSPLVSGDTDRALVYGYSQVQGGAFNLKVYVKTLVVGFDANGVVSDVNMQSSGER